MSLAELSKYYGRIEIEDGKPVWVISLYLDFDGWYSRLNEPGSN